MRLHRATTLVLVSLLSFTPFAAAQQDLDRCPDRETGQIRTYRNEKFGFILNYPSSFILDPQSVPPNGDSARFSTASGAATAVVSVGRNLRNLRLRQLMEEDRRDILQNGGGELTYERIRNNWYVISGYMVGRIFYQRTMLLRDETIATLWIEFPREKKPCFEGAVTTMSLSFRER